MTKIKSLLPSSMSFIFSHKNDAFTPTDIKVYTSINNVPSKTKWLNKVGEKKTHYNNSVYKRCLYYFVSAAL